MPKKKKKRKVKKSRKKTRRFIKSRKKTKKVKKFRKKSRKAKKFKKKSKRKKNSTKKQIFKAPNQSKDSEGNTIIKVSESWANHAYVNESKYKKNRANFI